MTYNSTLLKGRNSSPIWAWLGTLPLIHGSAWTGVWEAKATKLWDSLLTGKCTKNLSICRMTFYHELECMSTSILLKQFRWRDCSETECLSKRSSQERYKIKNWERDDFVTYQVIKPNLRIEVMDALWYMNPIGNSQTWPGYGMMDGSKFVLACLIFVFRKGSNDVEVIDILALLLGFLEIGQVQRFKTVW